MDESHTPTVDAEKVQAFMNNWQEIAAKSQALVESFIKEHGESSLSGAGNLATVNPDPFNLAGAFMEMSQALLKDPQGLIEKQAALWGDYLRLWQTSAARLTGGHAEPVIEAQKGDRRFASEEWRNNAVFDFIRQAYLLSARYLMEQADAGTKALDAKSRQKIEFFTRQYVDALSPSNFAATNPAVLRATVESKGENLIKGLQHMLEDLKRGKGNLKISMTDESAFEVGKNIATTPGRVVFQNRMFQLIQYSPATETVYETPLLIVPPWINKYYILDLKPENSFIRWAVEQGLTVFVMSWVNPDERYRDVSFDDYMAEGVIEALGQVLKISKTASAHAIGYCIGGTLLAATLAWLAKTGGAKKVKSATFFTTQVDFSEAGELSLFIDEEQVKAIEARMAEKGYLDANAMASTFNLLRANDLIWSFVINNYLLGKEPARFDLLYWNSDSTNLPAAMHSFYLRNFYKDNKLVQPGGVSMKGVPIDLSAIKTPCFIQAGIADHIAPPQSCYKIAGHFSGERLFMLAGSGHIAGVINPPAANKYQYWTNAAIPPAFEEWQAGATEHPGSWWPFWMKWLSAKSGKKIAARTPEDGIEAAPGSYVRQTGPAPGL